METIKTLQKFFKALSQEDTYDDMCNAMKNNKEDIFLQFDVLAQRGDWNGVNEFLMDIESYNPDLEPELIESLNADQIHAYNNWHSFNGCGYDKVTANQ